MILVIVVVTVATWNRGPHHSATLGPPAPSQSQTAAVSTGAAPDGTYKIIFDGTATGHTDRPNLGQTTKSSDATATWHLEYTYGDGHNGFPDLASSSVKACDSFRLHPPFMGDLSSAPGAGCDDVADVDPYYLTWGGSHEILAARHRAFATGRSRVNQLQAVLERHDHGHRAIGSGLRRRHALRQRAQAKRVGIEVDNLVRSSS